MSNFIPDTPPELWFNYAYYVNYCTLTKTSPVPEAEWTKRHEAYLAKQPAKAKSLEQRIADLERRLDEQEAGK